MWVEVLTSVRDIFGKDTCVTSEQWVFLNVGMKLLHVNHKNEK